MSTIDLTICVSTVYEKKERVWSVFKDLNAVDNVECLAIVQRSPEDKAYVEGGVKVYEVTSSGLSKSRNIGLKSALGKYVWIMDDDVVIKSGDLDYVISQIKSCLADVFIGKIRCSDKSGFYKNYRRKRKGKLGALRVSSIEIIVRRSCVVKEIYFDESMGLGTNYPSGEEALFLLSLYDHGYQFKYLNHDVAAHPCMIERKDLSVTWDNEGILKSKGIVARRFGGIVGFLLVIRWSLRAVLISKKAYSGRVMLFEYIKTATKKE